MHKKLPLLALCVLVAMPTTGSENKNNVPLLVAGAAIGTTILGGIIWACWGTGQKPSHDHVGYTQELLRAADVGYGDAFTVLQNKNALDPKSPLSEEDLRDLTTILLKKGSVASSSSIRDPQAVARAIEVFRNQKVILQNYLIELRGIKGADVAQEASKIESTLAELNQKIAQFERFHTFVTCHSAYIKLFEHDALVRQKYAQALVIPVEKRVSSELANKLIKILSLEYLRDQYPHITAYESLQHRTALLQTKRNNVDEERYPKALSTTDTLIHKLETLAHAAGQSIEIQNDKNRFHADTVGAESRRHEEKLQREKHEHELRVVQEQKKNIEQLAHENRMKEQLLQAMQKFVQTFNDTLHKAQQNKNDLEDLIEEAQDVIRHRSHGQ